ncbi:hypothetical protein [Lentibacillus sediminis]|uniref:hypothetical protein n=1 Tax=Lentibacillus sediminis TaxID=1940529 RepID=UPI000C1B881E|nr:hypothetical protein [Lentibacillus sediminis]
MLDNIIGRLPEKMILFCTLFAFLVPYTVYKINQKLHKYGDPPWKSAEVKQHDKQRPGKTP